MMSTLAIAVLVSASVGPRYAPLSPLALALQAELIVDGTVVAPGPPRSFMSGEASFFRLEVNEVVAGSLDQTSLCVRQFADWPCASRHADYARGQRAIFHLVRERQTDGTVAASTTWRVLGAGNEGEAPVADGTVFHRAYGWRERSREHRVAGAEFPGVATTREEYVAAVKGLRRLFEWPPKSDREWRSFRVADLAQLGSEAQVARFARSSKTAGTLVRRLRARIEGK